MKGWARSDAQETRRNAAFLKAFGVTSSAGFLMGCTAGCPCCGLVGCVIGGMVGAVLCAVVHLCWRTVAFVRRCIPIGRSAPSSTRGGETNEA